MSDAPRIFSTDYYAALRLVEEKHPWARSMRRLEMELLGRAVRGRSGLRILDSGCGSSLFVRECAERFNVERIVAGDVSFDALRLAQERDTPGLTGCSTVRLPFPDESFDVVVSNDVLQHLKVGERDQALPELARVLRRRGFCLIRTAARRGLGSKKQLDSDDYRQWEKRALRGAIEQAGLGVRFLARVNWLPALLADLRALRRARPEGDQGLELDPDEPAWKQRALELYWTLERTLLLAGVRAPSGHTLIALAEKRG